MLFACALFAGGRERQREGEPSTLYPERNTPSNQTLILRAYIYIYIIPGSVFFCDAPYLRDDQYTGAIQYQYTGVIQYNWFDDGVGIKSASAD